MILIRQANAYVYACVSSLNDHRSRILSDEMSICMHIAHAHQWTERSCYIRMCIFIHAVYNWVDCLYESHCRSTWDWNALRFTKLNEVYYMTGIKMQWKIQCLNSIAHMHFEYVKHSVAVRAIRTVVSDFWFYFSHDFCLERAWHWYSYWVQLIVNKQILRIDASTSI